MIYWLEKTFGFEAIFMWNPVFPSVNCSTECVVSRFSVHQNYNSAVGKTGCVLDIY